MKKLFAVFSRNWGLKLLALALAILVYYTMREKAGDASLFPDRSDIPADRYPVPVTPPQAPTLAPVVPAPESPLNVK